jgi:putative sigma-54 modulation protein
MKINIVGKNMELTEAIKTYVSDKVQSLEKLLNTEGGEPMAEVEVGKTTMHHEKGEVFRAEINLTSGGQFLRAEATKDDLYAAIDVAKDEMMMELRREKDKKGSIWKRGAAKFKNLIRGIEEDNA